MDQVVRLLLVTAVAQTQQHYPSYKLLHDDTTARDYTQPLLFGVATKDARGHGVLPLPIPAVPGLAGLGLTLQGIDLPVQEIAGHIIGCGARFEPARRRFSGAEGAACREIVPATCSRHLKSVIFGFSSDTAVPILSQAL